MTTRKDREEAKQAVLKVLTFNPKRRLEIKRLTRLGLKRVSRALAELKNEGKVEPAGRKGFWRLTFKQFYFEALKETQKRINQQLLQQGFFANLALEVDAYKTFKAKSRIESLIEQYEEERMKLDRDLLMAFAGIRGGNADADRSTP